MQTNEEIREKIRQSHRNKAGPRGFFSKAASPCFRTCLSTAFFFFFLDILALKIDRADAVPDPEPKLLDSNFVEPSKLQLLFRPSGKYAASTHYIHIRVPFNFSRLTLMPDLIFDRYHRYIDIWPEPSRTQVKKVAELSRSCLADKHNDKNMLDASTDLQGCNKMGETYFCKGRNVLLTDLTKTCLGALYLADNQNIHSRCKFSVGGAQEKIFRLADQDLGQIRRRGSPQRTGNHVQGGQGAGQRSPLQSLDLHLPRNNDRSHPSLLHTRRHLWLRQRCTT